MIGKSEWFQRRKYGGWGISPRTWQGWFYLAIVLIPFFVFQALPYWSLQLRFGVTCGWLLFLIFDAIHIMVTLPRDEREHRVESIAERNAAWVMTFFMIAGILYQLFRSVYFQDIQLDWFLVVALFAGVIVKTITNIVYNKKTL
ncbi:MAG: hypothetical protein COU29_03040 [Candidatus Magasanikbacteria bacterium CG10_big_fil_rev_8_21_14_0_10_36_32]|uniref:Uncharacterized protein n=1 Tax=Candidatus Magasanikbacteria bacterium CG10_big_fil_rev_8_21_14_0_10_36_32 TaxID=1974646 RepID=A0A2M6W601_9BACT|nr:MAG: hypothetical protein COU29_03040 [Candidatus Magasanikbacteria bacterium CG10_big_fil_rev_8_21_14_0_10_36_32]